MTCYSTILSISVARLGTTITTSNCNLHSFKRLSTLCHTNSVNKVPATFVQQKATFHKFCPSSLVGSKPSTDLEDKKRFLQVVGSEPAGAAGAAAAAREKIIWRRLCSHSSFKGNFKLLEPPSPTSNTTSQRKMSSSRGDRLKIVIFYGSTRNGRMCDRVGTAVKRAVEANGLEAIVLDPLELPVEMLKLPLHFMPNPAEAPAWILDTNDTIKSAHGFIFVSTEYNCGVPPPLANLIDHFPPPSFRHRPVGIITYSLGQFGGTRSATLLRPFASELGMVSIPATVPIPLVNTVIDDKGTVLEERVSKNIDKLIKELEWYAKGLKAMKEANPPPS